MWVRIPAWPVAALVSLSKTLNHNCFVLRMGRKAVGPVCCVMHVKEPRTLIVKEKGLAPVFLDSRLEHPAEWICARYKSSVLLLSIWCFKLSHYRRKSDNSNLSTLTPSLRRPCIHAIFFSTACRTACKHAFCFLRVRPEAVSTCHSWL